MTDPSPVHPGVNAMLLSLNAMIRAYSKLEPSRADDLQLAWLETVSGVTGKPLQSVLVELAAGARDPFLRNLQRLEAECADFARYCEEGGTRGRQLAIEAWTLDRITSAAEKAAFPFAAPLWALVEQLNGGEIPPPPDGADPFVRVIDSAVVDATASLGDRLVKLCELVRMLACLCTTEELNEFRFLEPLIDLMRRVGVVLADGEDGEDEEGEP